MLGLTARTIFGTTLLTLIASHSFAKETANEFSSLTDAQFYQNCLLRAAMTEASHTTLEQIRHSCKMLTSANTEADLKPLAKRRLNEIATQSNPFVITPHRVNYALFGHYLSGIYQAPFEQQSGKSLSFRDTELQFQLSFKIPLITQMHLLGKELDIYGAYTNRSFWQFFDDEDSIPFRETNHEPEIWTQMHTNLDFFNFNLHTLSIGINHQSNGQSGLLSRGWNRVFMQSQMQHDHSSLRFKTWIRFDEQDVYDNSFDYSKYLGDYELEAAHQFGNNTLALTLRNRYQINEYGALQLEYTYPLTKRLKGYIQYFDGYGDSLIEMEHKSQKLGFGIVLIDRF